MTPIKTRRTPERDGSRAIQGVALIGALAVLGYALWWGRHPSVWPYVLCFFVELPHPFIMRSRPRESLAPRLGERVLEVGPAGAR